MPGPNRTSEGARQTGPHGWTRDLTEDGDVEPNPGPGPRRSASEAASRATEGVRHLMSNWLSGSRRRAEAETVPGLIEESDDAPGTPEAVVSLDDSIPDIGDC
eukprot:10427879-Alexandrium_andersonii.AAC.1